MNIEQKLEQLTLEQLLSIFSESEKQILLEAIEEGYTWVGDSLSQAVCVQLGMLSKKDLNIKRIFLIKNNKEETFFETKSNYNPVIKLCQYKWFYELPLQYKPMGNWDSINYTIPKGLSYKNSFVTFLETKTLKIYNPDINLNTCYYPEIAKTILSEVTNKIDQGYIVNQRLPLAVQRGLFEAKLYQKNYNDCIIYADFAFITSEKNSFRYYSAWLGKLMGYNSRFQQWFLENQMFHYVEKEYDTETLGITKLKREHIIFQFLLCVYQTETCKEKYLNAKDVLDYILKAYLCQFKYDSLLQKQQQKLMMEYTPDRFMQVYDVAINAHYQINKSFIIKPFPGFNTKDLEMETKPNEVYFGLELEYKEKTDTEEIVDSCIAHLQESGYGIVTEDGSVDGEFVTEPLSHKEVTKFLNNKYLKIFLQSIAVGHNVGFHTHISKCAFKSQKSIASFTVLVNDCCLDKEFNKLIGEKSTYAVAQKKQLHNALDDQFSRYEAVNLSTGLPTVEVRCFRATKDVKILKNRFKFLKEAIAYCNQSDTYDYNKFKNKMRELEII